MAALESWQFTGYDGELRLGNSLLRGPIERDQHFGTCRIEARRARGPLRPPARMRLDIEPWSPTATALELIPCQRVRPSAAYFAAGHRLLDSLTRPLPVRVPLQLKCGGLDAGQLARRAVEPSTMSLLGLVRHLAEVERGWFRRRFAGFEVPKRY